MNEKYKKFHEVIENRAKYDPEYPEMNHIWNDMIEVFSEDIVATMVFLLNECSADEFSWLSEIFDGIAEKTQSLEFIDALKKVAAKYPDEVQKYYVMDFIESAEGCIEKKQNG